MRRHHPRRIYRHTFETRLWIGCLSAVVFLSLGLAIAGTLHVMITEGKVISVVGSYLLPFLFIFFFVARLLTYPTAIGTDDRYLWIRVYGIKWVPVPWEEVQEPQPVVYARYKVVASLLPLRRKLPRWYKLLELVGFPWPSVWIWADMPGYADLMEEIYRHLRREANEEETQEV